MFFVDTQNCTGCGECVEACPTGAISLRHNLAFIDQDVCQGCAACVDVCPQDAILIEETMPVECGSTDLVPTNAAPISVVADQSRSLSWRDAVVSTLLWTGREIAPRLANLAVDFLEQRVQSAPTNQNRQNLSVPDRFSNAQNGTGLRHRQRRRQRKFR